MHDAHRTGNDPLDSIFDKIVDQRRRTTDYAKHPLPVSAFN